MHVNFEDDNLLNDYKAFCEVLACIKEECGTITFSAENGLDYLQLTPKRIGEMVAMGASRFHLSLASPFSSTLVQQERQGDHTHFEQVVKSIHSCGREAIVYFICGFKEDTADKIAATLAYCAALPCRVGISLFYPVPGIAGFTDLSIFEGVEPCLATSSAAWPWNGSLSTAELVTAFRLSRLVNLWRAPFRPERHDRLLQQCLATNRLHTLVRQKKEFHLVPIASLSQEMVDWFFSNLDSTVRCDSAADYR